MDTQARIPAGLGAVHNFIMDHDDEDIHHYLPGIEPNEPQPALAGEPVMIDLLLLVVGHWISQG